MKLNTVYARFYKSFNFDHLRKAHPSAKPKPWEHYDGQWYPYIEIPIDSRITAVVGANESGKSHLLSAIEKAVTGEGIKQRDLCRYSPFFNVEKGKTCWPHLGLAWSEVTPEEASQIAEATGATHLAIFDRFLMFREGPSRIIIYLPDGEHFTDHVLENDKAKQFGKDILPRPFSIEPKIALPNSVPLNYLVNPTPSNALLASRRERQKLLQAGATLQQYWKSDANEFAQSAPNLYSAANLFFADQHTQNDEPDHHVEALELARNLLLELANLDPERLSDLSKAIIDGDDGHANALMTRINDQLARSINFPKWWAQDRDFSLQVTSREMDLVFTVKDRTGTEYTFGERSSGLKYFLSYLIQSQVHKSPGRPEILLMDEPDTFLSAEAQQDLLKIFDSFAEPPSGVPPVQVVYVTHSPFLLDKNHAERIRVLQKGRGFDGTRIIRNAAQNHYEPLRSAFGAFVGETAFIGSCNLLVEGTADQIVLSGIARLTRKSLPGVENDTLDLNRLVIVPCGSASQVPYMLYLVRGRDADKPPVIALLDSDSAGDKAARELKNRNDRRMRRLIDADLVLQLGELGIFEGAHTPSTVEIEDLVPPELAVAVANQCLYEIRRFRDETIVELTLEQFQSARTHTEPVFDALNAALKDLDVHIEKVVFARVLIDLCGKPQIDPALAKAVALFIQRMRLLYRRINTAKRKAEKESLKERVGTLVDRQQTLFVRDHPNEASREQASNLLEQILDVLDDSIESDAVRISIVGLRREFHLDDEPQDLITDYKAFKVRLSSLKDAFELQKHEEAEDEKSTLAHSADYQHHLKGHDSTTSATSAASPSDAAMTTA